MGPKPKTGMCLANARNVRGNMFSLLGELFGALKNRFPPFLFIYLGPLFYLFEGVCLTTVILTPGACEGRLRTGSADVDLAAAAAPA